MKTLTLIILTLLSLTSKAQFFSLSELKELRKLPYQELYQKLYTEEWRFYDSLTNANHLRYIIFVWGESVDESPLYTLTYVEVDSNKALYYQTSSRSYRDLEDFVNDPDYHYKLEDAWLTLNGRKVLPIKNTKTKPIFNGVLSKYNNKIDRDYVMLEESWKPTGLHTYIVLIANINSRFDFTRGNYH